MKTTYTKEHLYQDLLFSLALLITILIAASLGSCAPQAFPVGTPNPLDEPGYTAPTVEELHLENIRAITNNPAYR